ncbi:hypothetical protein AQAU111925_06790 [Aquirufa aurantiipilula]
MVPVKVPPKVPVPVLRERVTVPLAVAFTGLPLASVNVTITSKVAPAVLVPMLVITNFEAAPSE